MLQTVGAEKMDEKRGCLSSLHIFFLTYGL